MVLERAVVSIDNQPNSKESSMGFRTHFSVKQKLFLGAGFDLVRNRREKIPYFDDRCLLLRFPFSFDYNTNRSSVTAMTKNFLRPTL